jgi:hypothetical protein
LFREIPVAVGVLATPERAKVGRLPLLKVAAKTALTDFTRKRMLD